MVEHGPDIRRGMDWIVQKDRKDRMDRIVQKDWIAQKDWMDEYRGEQ